MNLTDQEFYELSQSIKNGDLRYAYYYIGGLAERDINEALSFANNHAKEGKGCLSEAVASYIYSEHGVEPNLEKWIHYNAVAANSGDPDAAINLANHYYHLEEYHLAKKWYEIAFNNGSAEATVTLGFMHEEGKGCDVSLVEAVRWFMKITSLPPDEDLSIGISVDMPNDSWPVDRSDGWIDQEKLKYYFSVSSDKEIEEIKSLINIESN